MVLLYLPSVPRHFRSVEQLSQIMATPQKGREKKPAGLCLGVLGACDLDADGLAEICDPL